MPYKLTTGLHDTRHKTKPKPKRNHFGSEALLFWFFHEKIWHESRRMENLTPKWTARHLWFMVEVSWSKFRGFAGIRKSQSRLEEAHVDWVIGMACFVASKVSLYWTSAVVAGSALFKECHFIPKKEQKWHFHPQIKNILLHILPVAKLCKSLKIFPAQPYPVEFQKSSVTTWAYHFEAINGSWLVFSRAKGEFAHNLQWISLSCFRWFVGDKELFLVL